LASHVVIAQNSKPQKDYIETSKIQKKKCSLLTD